MENRVSEAELQTLYRTARGQFLMLHRIMIRAGLIGERERITIYDLTKKA